MTIDKLSVGKLGLWERRLLEACLQEGPNALKIAGIFMARFRGRKVGRQALDLDWCCDKLWSMGPGRRNGRFIEIAGASQPPRYWRVTLTSRGRRTLSSGGPGNAS